MLFETDFTTRFPARSAYAVKDLPKVSVLSDLVLIITTQYIYTVSKKKGATGFFAVTFTNVDGFS